MRALHGGRACMSCVFLEAKSKAMASREVSEASTGFNERLFRWIHRDGGRSFTYLPYPTYVSLR